MKQIEDVKKRNKVERKKQKFKNKMKFEIKEKEYYRSINFD